MAGPQRLFNGKRNQKQISEGGPHRMDVQFLVLFSWSARTSVPLHLDFSFLDSSE